MDEGRINGRGKKCNGSSTVSRVPGAHARATEGLDSLDTSEGGLKALLSGDNPAIQNLIAPIYRGIAPRFPAGNVVSDSAFSHVLFRISKAYPLCALHGVYF